MQVRQLKSRGPGLRQLQKSRTWSATCRRQVGDKFSTSFRQIKKSRTWSATCLRPGLRQVGDLVSDKIDLMEFGHNRSFQLLLASYVLSDEKAAHLVGTFCFASTPAPDESSASELQRITSVHNVIHGCPKVFTFYEKN